MSHPKRILAEHLATASAPCLTASFQVESVVLIHMLRAIDAKVPVLFIDTCHHFPETIAYRDEIAYTLSYRSKSVCRKECNGILGRRVSQNG